MSVNMNVASTLSNREVIEAALTTIPEDNVTVEQVAVAVDVMGYGDRITTRQIRRHLIQKGIAA